MSTFSASFSASKTFCVSSLWVASRFCASCVLRPSSSATCLSLRSIDFCACNRETYLEQYLKPNQGCKAGPKLYYYTTSLYSPYTWLIKVINLRLSYTFARFPGVFATLFGNLIPSAPCIWQGSATGTVQVCDLPHKRPTEFWDGNVH